MSVFHILLITFWSHWCRNISWNPKNITISGNTLRRASKLVERHYSSNPGTICQIFRRSSDNLTLSKWYIDQLNVGFSNNLTISKAVQERLTQCARKDHCHFTTVLSHDFDQWQPSWNSTIPSLIKDRHIKSMFLQSTSAKASLSCCVIMWRQSRLYCILCLGQIEKIPSGRDCAQTYSGSEKQLKGRKLDEGNSQAPHTATMHVLKLRVCQESATAFYAWSNRTSTIFDPSELCTRSTQVGFLQKADMPI